MTRLIKRALPLLALSLLGGCNWVVMSPAGDVAVQQRDLILISTGLMLLIIVPVIALILFFAWRYRKGSPAAEAAYDPEWDHSTLLELIIWSAPLLIIIALGALTWSSTHRLDPYRPLERIAPGRAVPSNMKPIDVQVVSLDWKWLFIYPEYGIATVNELAIPVDRPVRFRLTSSTVMNAFYAPALAGMIYTMPAMETTLHAVLNRPGDYEGFSANYSGAGFSDMRFRLRGLDATGFDHWVRQVRASGRSLDGRGYLELARPSEADAVRRFGAVEPGLFARVVGQCVKPGTTCSAMGHGTGHATGAHQRTPEEKRHHMTHNLDHAGRTDGALD